MTQRASKSMDAANDGSPSHTACHASMRWRIAPLVAAALLWCAGPAVAGLKFEYAMSIGTEGVGEGQFKYVEDLAFSREGHLVVTDASHAWVQVFDKTTGQFIARFGGKGDDDPQLDKPEGIAIDPDGYIFVADYSTGFVKKYSPGFKWLLTFSEYGSDLGQNMKSEFMDIRDGRLYMPDTGNHRVNVFDLSGKPLFDFGGPGKEPGKFSTPEAAKFNGQGTLYVTDLRNDRIQIFSADGKLIGSIGRSGSGPGELRSPAGIAFDKDDNIYVTEIANNRVQVFDKTGKFLTMWGTAGSGNGQFGNLHGILVDKATGTVYVADTSNHRIQVFKPAPATLPLGAQK